MGNNRDLPDALHRLSEAHKNNPCNMCRHFHHWDDGKFFEHIHPKGQIPHGHHGSRYGQTTEGDIKPPPPTGAELIAKERERQITQEGWTSEHDAEHTEGQLAMAAACYVFDVASLPTIDAKRFIFDNWPWSRKWWKPTPENTIRQLTKAGALIAAEIDRIQRQKTCPE